MNAHDKDMEITLPILQSIEQQSNITQRTLSKKLGLALGLTNAYLRHCINKGLIKIEQIPANRYLYYLTPKGFSEKTRLTAQYLSRSFYFYRKAGQACLQLFNQCRLNHQKEVVLCGISDLAEVALLRAARAETKVLGIYDPHYEGDAYLKHVVWHSRERLPLEAVFLVTVFEVSQQMVKDIQQVVGSHRVLVPSILLT
ncbi:winged helix-turn-helix transcriptional regulator [Coxiella endosymbiont of Ornithodoros maritimus]|uniref:winged helix-turn-helix transcriptional regulator n=1 Tax=Coxiella endosymbiont of Ornithodoros maritimus TaxID=1656172 RepID=UPI002263BD21|nr:winged helix-turn-helix transcriptional regulator [Coxiella endosymbiont of Ornithodoros maritimus]